MLIITSDAICMAAMERTSASQLMVRFRDIPGGSLTSADGAVIHFLPLCQAGRILCDLGCPYVAVFRDRPGLFFMAYRTDCLFLSFLCTGRGFFARPAAIRMTGCRDFNINRAATTIFTENFL